LLRYIEVILAKRLSMDKSVKGYSVSPPEGTFLVTEK
jgi:hypothetical protein